MPRSVQELSRLRVDPITERPFLLGVMAAADELVGRWLMGDDLEDGLENLKNALTKGNE